MCLGLCLWVWVWAWVWVCRCGSGSVYMGMRVWNSVCRRARVWVWVWHWWVCVCMFPNLYLHCILGVPLSRSLVVPCTPGTTHKIKKNTKSITKSQKLQNYHYFSLCQHFYTFAKTCFKKTHWFYLNHSTFELNAERTLIDSVSGQEYTARRADI